MGASVMRPLEFFVVATLVGMAGSVLICRQAVPSAVRAANPRAADPAAARWRRCAKVQSASGFDSSDPAAAMQILSPAQLDSPLGAELFERWVDRDPRAATSWACSVAAEAWGRRLLATAGEVWARRDLAAALDWLDEQPDSAAADQLRAVFGYAAVDAFPRTALRLALELPAGASQDTLGALAVSTWAAQEPLATADFIQQLPEGEGRDRLFVALTSSWARLDGLAALRCALRWLPPGEAQTRAVETIVRCGGSDAGKWIAGVSVDSLQGMDLPAWLVLWAAYDRESAGEWLGRLQPDTVRDESVAAYARCVAAARPAEALAWVARIDDPQLREETMTRVQEARR